MTAAKAIGGGMPLAVCIAAPKWADVLGPGSHGCTMGGSPICAAAALACAELIEEENLVQAAIDKGKLATDQLTAAKLPGVQAIRGKGLMIGLAFDETKQAADMMKAAHSKGLLTCTGKNNVLRVAPPLNVDEATLTKGINLLIDVVKNG
jgi:acetylornithine/succinyldiaminopimelate/putrescine aminotransferase